MDSYIEYLVNRSSIEELLDFIKLNMYLEGMSPSTSNANWKAT